MPDRLLASSLLREGWPFFSAFPRISTQLHLFLSSPDVRATIVDCPFFSDVFVSATGDVTSLQIIIFFKTLYLSNDFLGNMGGKASGFKHVLIRGRPLALSTIQGWDGNTGANGITVRLLNRLRAFLLEAVVFYHISPVEAAHIRI